MRVISVAFVALAIPLVMCYDEKFDKFDVEKVLGDDTLLSGYVDCMLEKGPCTLEYSEEFKKVFPEVIATACAKCTPIQRQHIRKTVKAISEKKPAEFDQFKKKYDPKGEYEADFATFMSGTD